MRFLLLIPYQEIESYVLPNLGLGYVASALKKAGHEVDYLDGCKERLLFPKMLLETGKYDALGVQMYSYTSRIVKAICRRAKELQPGLITLVGGPHPNAIPRETLEESPEIDLAVQGEGELALPPLAALLGEGASVRDERLAAVPNLAWRDASGRCRVNARVVISDLDQLALPAWDLMDPRVYPRLAHGFVCRGHPIAPVFATRGCPYACTYCSAHANMGNRVRRRSPSKVVDEIELLVKEYGVREIHFEDDNFTFYKDFAAKVCQGILDRNLRIHWACPNGVRLDSLDKELLQIMERSGCYSLALGIESGSDRVLRLMRKGTTTAKLRQKIDLIAETTRIRMTGFAMVSYPTQTLEEIRATERFVLEAPIHRFAAGIFLPLPGTRIQQQLVARGKMPADYDWSKLSPYDEDVFTDGTLTKKEIFDAKRRMQLKFYLRPRIIWGLLFELRSWEQYWIAFRMLLFWLGLIRMKKPAGAMAESCDGRG
jgi:radical SAM superfamily enzyme YgiQ (UPF0313 family)